MFDQVCSGFFWREAFNMGYWLYYPMIATVAIYGFFGRPREAERTTFIIMCSFFIYYFIYIFLPVAGPQFYFPVIGDGVALAGPYPELGDYFNLNPEITIAQEGKGGLFTELVGMAQSSGERPTAAFPSSHIGVTTILVILAYRLNRRIFAVMFPVYLLLCCATVYIKAHYLVDAIAGLVTGALFYMLTSWIYRRLFKG
jgi:membrane-associated phospholipid phosphatase